MIITTQHIKDNTVMEEILKGEVSDDLRMLIKAFDDQVKAMPRRLADPRTRCGCITEIQVSLSLWSVQLESYGKALGVVVNHHDESQDKLYETSLINLVHHNVQRSIEALMVLHDAAPQTELEALVEQTEKELEKKTAEED